MLKTFPEYSDSSAKSRVTAAGRCVLTFLTLLWIVGGASSLLADQPDDWSFWRGPEMNGISREKNLPETWSVDGKNLMWRKPEYGTRCTPIIMNNRIYLVCRDKPETTEEGEKTVCLDADTGELIWQSVHNIYLSDAPAERVGWSSVVGDPDTGNVYVFGLGCLFQCLDGKTGDVIWERALSEEYGMLSTYGGRTNFPVVFENLVIISGVMTQWGDNAIPAHRFIAFDKRTGEAVWFISTRVKPEDTTYSTPVFTTFNGQAAMVVGAGDGDLYAFQPRTGEVIWKYEASPRGFSTTPLVVDNIVYCGHAEKNRVDTTILGAIWAVDGRLKGDIPEDKLLWKVNGKTVGRSSPLMMDGRLYMMEDGGTLLTIDPSNGKILQEKKVGREMFGSLVGGDGKIYCGEATGNFWIFRPTEKGLDTLSRVRLNREEILSSPIIYHGRIYFTSTAALYCIGDASATASADPIPAAPKEVTEPADTQVAHIQVVPVEDLLRPGDKVHYRVLAFNAHGQKVESSPAAFSLDGPGSLDGNGVLTVASGSDHYALKVTAKVGDLISTRALASFRRCLGNSTSTTRKFRLLGSGPRTDISPRNSMARTYWSKSAGSPKGLAASPGWDKRICTTTRFKATSMQRANPPHVLIWD